MPWLQRNWFLIGIVLVIVVGVLLPAPIVTLAADGLSTTIIVVILFLITGLKLPTEKIRAGLAAGRLHFFIQLFIFVITPLYFLTAALLFRHVLDGRLLIGIYALAVLPTTVSSCIVFTQSSGGNSVAAIFNAALANAAGIFISPLLLSLMLRGSGSAMPASRLLSTLLNLGTNMLLPIVIGQVVRVWIREWVTAHRQRLSDVSNVLILLIVLFAMARSASNPGFIAYARELPWPFVYLAASHLLLVGIVILAGKLLRLPAADQITALFVAPQKTLALGAPLLSVYFAGQELLGVALLPLVLYHPWQLVVAAGLKSTRYLKRLSALAAGGSDV